MRGGRRVMIDFDVEMELYAQIKVVGVGGGVAMR